MSEHLNVTKTNLDDSTIFIFAKGNGTSKNTGKDFYNFSYLALNKFGQVQCGYRGADGKTYTSKFCNKEVFDSITDIGYYSVKSDFSGNIQSVTLVKKIDI